MITVYKLRCTKFEYSSEEISTGISDIDATEDDLSTNMTTIKLVLRQGWQNLEL